MRIYYAWQFTKRGVENKVGKVRSLGKLKFRKRRDMQVQRKTLMKAASEPHGRSLANSKSCEETVKWFKHSYICYRYVATGYRLADREIKDRFPVGARDFSLEMNGQLHAPAALIPGKWPSVSIVYEARWASRDPTGKRKTLLSLPGTLRTHEVER
jgi:hypothetical protein